MIPKTNQQGKYTLLTLLINICLHNDYNIYYYHFCICICRRQPNTDSHSVLSNLQISADSPDLSREEASQSPTQRRPSTSGSSSISTSTVVSPEQLESSAAAAAAAAAAANVDRAAKEAEKEVVEGVTLGVPPKGQRQSLEKLFVSLHESAK